MWCDSSGWEEVFEWLEWRLDWQMAVSMHVDWMVRSSMQDGHRWIFYSTSRGSFIPNWSHFCDNFWDGNDSSASNLLVARKKTFSRFSSFLWQITNHFVTNGQFRWEKSAKSWFVSFCFDFVPANVPAHKLHATSCTHLVRVRFARWNLITRTFRSRMPKPNRRIMDYRFSIRFVHFARAFHFRNSLAFQWKRPGFSCGLLQNLLFSIFFPPKISHLLLRFTFRWF